MLLTCVLLSRIWLYAYNFFFIQSPFLSLSSHETFLVTDLSEGVLPQHFYLLKLQTKLTHRGIHIRTEREGFPSPSKAVWLALLRTTSDSWPAPPHWLTARLPASNCLLPGRPCCGQTAPWSILCCWAHPLLQPATAGPDKCPSPSLDFNGTWPGHTVANLLLKTSFFFLLCILVSASTSFLENRFRSRLGTE